MTPTSWPSGLARAIAHPDSVFELVTMSTIALYSDVVDSTYNIVVETFDYRATASVAVIGTACTTAVQEEVSSQPEPLVCFGIHVGSFTINSMAREKQSRARTMVANYGDLFIVIGCEGKQPDLVAEL